MAMSINIVNKLHLNAFVVMDIDSYDGGIISECSGPVIILIFGVYDALYIHNVM